MQKLHFTQEQITNILQEIANGEAGMQQVLKISLEAIMRAERQEHNNDYSDHSNGYRPRKSFGSGKILELRVPRTRQGNFYPVLLSLLKDQEEESRKLAFSLYGAGLTTNQVGELFEEIYGRYYSNSHVSRMFNFAREEVAQWLERPLDPYYPIVYIDATYIATRRGDSVMKEAYYTILGVRPDRTREVLCIVNFPTESALAWQEVFSMLKSRGVRELGLVVSDGLKSIEDAVAREYPGTSHQLCVVHLQRNILKEVKPKHKQQVSEDLKDIFRTDDRNDTIAHAYERWLAFCGRWGVTYKSIGRRAQDERYRLYFTYIGYDHRIRSMIYSTNWVERLNRDYKRTTRMRGALPNPEATILLLGHVAMTRKAYLRKTPRLDYEDQKFKWEQ